ncbi:MAG: KUP/HAK/KT family potassium transporter [Candidatus Eremiobacteraeota bacterium]|nr:KUP/HAK/KT family potassium transporter [Candidatus Eremiobacteraeota bacterium]
MAPPVAERRHDVSNSLAVAALGVVFGDIGTSPLYTFKTCFTTANVQPTPENVLGIVSLLLWTLFWVACFKYVTVLMRVDHEGEGGILALLALASPPKILGVPIRGSWLVWVVVIGAAMLLGDGIITPAISVISAVEGIGVATTRAQPFIVPLSAAVLVALFALQSRGTGRIGRVFGPVMLLWFVAIGVAGVIAIAGHPHIIAAVDPRHALYFVTHHGIYGFLIFGAIVLCVTGAEALYADLSHFGRLPITRAWYLAVLPALVLNYMGQGATVLSDAHRLDSPFYALTNGWTLLPMVVLATVATVIASQSLISGAFTLAEQAIALNLSPRLKVLHTSLEHRGQVYVPFINGVLAVACLILVFAFRSSDRLASAYGLAVACTMAATSVVFYVVATDVLHWKRALTVPLVCSFLAVDLTFVLAGLPKFADGAWVPLAISAVVVTLAITWLEGRRCTAKSLAKQQQPISEFLLENGTAQGPILGSMVLFTGDPNGVPFVAHHPWLRRRLQTERIVLLTLIKATRPYVEEENRVKVENLSDRFTRVSGSFGYMERPRIDPILAACKRNGLDIDNELTSFVYADPKIQASPAGMPTWQRTIFDFLQRVSHPLPDELRVRAERRVELGVEIQV